MKYAKSLVAFAAAAVATAALAAVTFDSATGMGFVGKGDVQLAFGWNNKQLQDNALMVGFEYDAQEHYTVVCEFTTGEGTPGKQTHLVPVSRSTKVSGEISGDVRKANQFNGFNLTGYSGAPVMVGSVPQVGQSCLGWGVQGVVESSTLSSTTGGLYATFNTQRALLQ